jgi:hypothetical protein
LHHDYICMLLALLLMILILMNYPDVRIKPPNYYLQLIRSSAAILNPRNQNFLLPNFFLLAQKVSRDWKGTEPSPKEKWPECILTLIIHWDIFCILVRSTTFSFLNTNPSTICYNTKCLIISLNSLRDANAKK